MRQTGRLLLLALLLCAPLACDQSANNPAPVGNPRLDFDAIFPEDWQHIKTYSLDTSDDDRKEWVVMYRFDLLPEREQRGSPIAAVVYQPDDARPPNIVAHPLRPPPGDYLCECKCIPQMEDVLSGLNGLELVVRDKCDKKTTRLSIFRWNPDQGEYLSKGHFRGSDITWDENEVTVQKPWSGRAQLAVDSTHHACDNNTTFYQPGGQGVLVECEKRELVFPHGEPEDIMCSPYPENVVLAFYTHYTEEEARTYFTQEGWERVGQCAGSECGCTSQRSEIEHVRVIDLRPEDSDPDAQQATVEATIVCERRNGAPENERLVRWSLVREDDRWHLE